MGTTYPKCTKCTTSLYAEKLGKIDYCKNLVKLKGRVYKCPNCASIFMTFNYKKYLYDKPEIERFGTIYKENNIQPINNLHFNWDTFEITEQSNQVSGLDISNTRLIV